jgi:enoyl-CoA hydratase
MKTSLDLAHRIASNPPLAIQRIKAGLRRALDPNWSELGAWVSESLTELFRTEDHREGVRAFLEKRPARFIGR